MSSTNNLKGLIEAIVNTNDKFTAKSIAERARENIYMYRVAISSSIGDPTLASNIAKYIEGLCGMFTLMVAGINPIAQTNDDIHQAVAGISAENYTPLAVESIDPVIKALERASIPYEAPFIPTPKRIGRKAALSNEAGSPPSNISIVESQFISKVEVENVRAFPTIINIKLRIGGDNTITLPVAVKAVCQGMGSEEIRLFLECVLAGRAFQFLRFFKWRSGEINTVQYVFGTDIAKKEKKMYENLGRNPMYIEFMKRKQDSTRKGIRKAFVDEKTNSIPPTASFIVTTDDLVSATRLNIDRFTKNNDLIVRIMREVFLMCFGIVDMDRETVSFYFMGYKDPFIQTFNELSKVKNNQADNMLEIIRELSRKVGY